LRLSLSDGKCVWVTCLLFHIFFSPCTFIFSSRPSFRFRSPRSRQRNLFPFIGLLHSPCPPLLRGPDVPFGRSFMGCPLLFSFGTPLLVSDFFLFLLFRFVGGVPGPQAPTDCRLFAGSAFFLLPIVQRFFLAYWSFLLGPFNFFSLSRELFLARPFYHHVLPPARLYLFWEHFLDSGFLGGCFCYMFSHRALRP